MRSGNMAKHSMNLAKRMWRMRIGTLSMNLAMRMWRMRIGTLSMNQAIRTWRVRIGKRTLGIWGPSVTTTIAITISITNETVVAKELGAMRPTRTTMAVT